VKQNYNTAFCLCGCETWSVTLREEHKLRVFENRVLRKIFGPKKDDVTGEWSSGVPRNFFPGGGGFNKFS